MERKYRFDSKQLAVYWKSMRWSSVVRPTPICQSTTSLHLVICSVFHCKMTIAEQYFRDSFLCIKYSPLHGNCVV